MRFNTILQKLEPVERAAVIMACLGLAWFGVGTLSVLHYLLNNDNGIDSLITGIIGVLFGLFLFYRPGPAARLLTWLARKNAKEQEK
jgi:uncharacterized membrane protein HdeD (DUF308 family)